MLRNRAMGGRKLTVCSWLHVHRTVHVYSLLCVCIKALELRARRAPVCAARVSRAILMVVCCNGIQADVCSQTASGSQLPIYNSHTWILTHTETHTFKSSRLMAFFSFFFLAFFLMSLCTCTSLCIYVFVFISQETNHTLEVNELRCVCPGKQAEN